MKTGSAPAGRPAPSEPDGGVQPAARASRLGLGLILLGTVLGALSLSVLNWFRGTLHLLHGSQSTAGDIGDLLDRLVSERRALDDRNAFHLGLSDYYFSWLAWVLLAAAFIVAIVATLPTSEGGPVRFLAVLLAVLGILATLWSLDVYRPAHDPRLANGPSYAQFVSHTSYGAWAAFAAFVLIGFGAVLGPGPRPARAPRDEDAALGSGPA